MQGPAGVAVPFAGGDNFQILAGEIKHINGVWNPFQYSCGLLYSLFVVQIYRMYIGNSLHMHYKYPQPCGVIYLENKPIVEMGEGIIDTPSSYNYRQHTVTMWYISYSI